MFKSQKINKICIIGNSCSGKTTLSRRIANYFNLPLTHVDAIQFISGMRLRDPVETRKILIEIAKQDEWIIDGFGPLNIIESRFTKADVIIFIYLPIWRSYLWCVKRQVLGIFVRRQELPEGCFESTFSQTIRLFKIIWNTHHKMWPQLDRIFLKDEFKNKVVYIRKLSDFKKIQKIVYKFIET